MAKEILRDPVITINGVDLTSSLNEVTINSEKDLVEVTSFGAAYKQNLLGLGDGTIELSGFQDFAAASVDATLWPIHSNNSEVAVVVTKGPGAVSATNPRWTMTGVLPEYTPLSGSVGEASTVNPTFQNSGSTGIVRTTA